MAGTAEHPATVNGIELGNLGLSDNDEDAIVEFVKTFPTVLVSNRTLYINCTILIKSTDER